MELSLGLAQHIPALISPRVSDASARDWLRIWEELAGDRPEFQISLQFLAAAVRYRSRGSAHSARAARRARTLLAPLLAGGGAAASPAAEKSAACPGRGAEGCPPPQ